MACCCAENEDSGMIVMLKEVPAMRSDALVEVDDDDAEEFEAKQRADEKAAEAVEAQRKQAAEDESRRKEEAEEEARRRKTLDESPPAAPAEEAFEPALAPVVEDPGLQLTFREPGGANTYTVEFRTKPLGMDFVKDAKPVKVHKAFCAAKNLGVQEGSELLNIGGTDVEKMDFGQMLEVLKAGIEPLQPEGLVIVFRVQDGKQRTVIFPTKPLSMDFGRGQKPIKVLEARGTAQNLGVEADWELMSIAGTDVEEMDFDMMLELLQSKIGSLPIKE